MQNIQNESFSEELCKICQSKGNIICFTYSCKAICEFEIVERGNNVQFIQL